MLPAPFRRRPLWWLAPPPFPYSGGTMGAGHFSQFARGAAAKEKPYNRASPVEMHPFCRLRRRLPRRGRFALHFAYRFISSTEAERKANFPLRGKPREAGIGVHFHRAEGLACLFPPPGRAVLWFYQNWRRGAHHNPRAKGPSNLRTLRTFGPAGPVHLSPLNPEPSEPFEPYVPFHFML